MVNPAWWALIPVCRCKCPVLQWIVIRAWRRKIASWPILRLHTTVPRMKHTRYDRAHSGMLIRAHFFFTARGAHETTLLTHVVAWKYISLEGCHRHLPLKDALHCARRLFALSPRCVEKISSEYPSGGVVVFFFSFGGNLRDEYLVYYYTAGVYCVPGIVPSVTHAHGKVSRQKNGLN